MEDMPQCDDHESNATMESNKDSSNLSVVHVINEETTPSQNSDIYI